MYYLRGEPQYDTDHRKTTLPENVRQALVRLLESGEPAVQTADHTISSSRAFAYARGTKQPSATIYAELVQAYG